MDVRLFVMINAWWIGGKARVTFGRRGSDTVAGVEETVEVAVRRDEKPYNAAEQGEFLLKHMEHKYKTADRQFRRQRFRARLNVCFIYLFLYPRKQISANKLSWYSPPVTWRYYVIFYYIVFNISYRSKLLVAFFSPQDIILLYSRRHNSTNPICPLLVLH